MSDYAGAAAPVSTLRRRGAKTRRRFLILSVAALAVLATALGVSFTANTGVTTLTATTSASTSSLVHAATYSSGATVATGLPTGVSWKYAVPPAFSAISVGSPAVVKTSGDIAIIDGTDTTSSNVLVTVYVTNMQGLAKNYSSYALPVQVYGDNAVKSDGTIDTSVSSFSGWNSSAIPASTGTYLTNTSGYESFTLPTGAGVYYEITLDSGGSLYPYSTSDTSDLAPTFYITAQ